MNEAEALDIISGSIWIIGVVSAPPIIAAMVVGVAIALLQALTQIQEMTLTFVPKMIAVMLVIYLSGPFMGANMYRFSDQLYDKIAHIGR